MKLRKTTDWALRLVAAAILFQTLFFKFSGAEESVYIFTKLGMEPWGRLGSGVAELIACLLLLYPSTVVYGAGLALGVISGAIVSHLTQLGIVVLDDGGLLFSLALAVFACSAALLWLHRGEIPWIGPRLFGGGPGGGGHRHGGSTAEGGSVRRVVVVGGGFGGTYTAPVLDRALAGRDDVRVTAEGLRPGTGGQERQVGAVSWSRITTKEPEDGLHPLPRPGLDRPGTPSRRPR